MKIYTEKDITKNALEGKKVAVIGYGAQGRAQSVMMHSSGVDIIAGIRLGGLSEKQATEDGVPYMTIEEAVKKAHIIHILLPDEIQKEVYENQILPNLTEGKVISFSHGFNIVFERIEPPKGVDVIMVAPKAPGTEELKEYRKGFGVPALIAIYKDESGEARDIALSMAHAMHFSKAGILECSFGDETYEDLFGEQAVLCGGAVGLVKAGFETLTEAGYPPAMAYFECLHELKLIVDLMYEGGIEHMYHVVSNTAEFGGRCFEDKINNPHMKEVMKHTLKEIENGNFAQKWMEDFAKGIPLMKKMREEGKTHPIEKTGTEVRDLFKKD